MLNSLKKLFLLIVLFICSFSLAQEAQPAIDNEVEELSEFDMDEFIELINKEEFSKLDDGTDPETATVINEPIKQLKSKEIESPMVKFELLQIGDNNLLKEVLESDHFLVPLSPQDENIQLWEEAFLNSELDNRQHQYVLDIEGLLLIMVILTGLVIVRLKAFEIQ